MTTVQIVGASGHTVQIDAEGSDLQTVTRTAKALWKDTRESVVPESPGAGYGFTGERRASYAYSEPLQMTPPTARSKRARRIMAKLTPPSSNTNDKGVTRVR